MEELIQLEFEELSNVKLQDYGIRTIKNKNLLAPGFWNGRNYSAEEIIKAYKNTNWEDKDVVSLIADHRDDDRKGRPLTIRDWLGFVSNHFVDENPNSKEYGFVKGDLNLCDINLSNKLIDGKAPFGISPFVQGKHDEMTNSQRDFIFKNFAIVVEPACKECYINEYLGDDGLNVELAELPIEERINMKLGDIKSPEKIEKEMKPKENKKKKDEEEQITCSSTEELPHSIQMKGGKNKMTDENLNENVSFENLSEEQILSQIGKLSELLSTKKSISPEQERLTKLESDVTSLKEVISKLSESFSKLSEKLSEKQESDNVKEITSEKLEAKSKTMPMTKLSEDKSFKGMFNKGPSNGSRDAFEKLSSLGFFD